MGKPSGVLVASFLFLILSGAPIDAARVHGAQNSVATSLSTKEVADSDWHVFATHEENCVRWQREFEQRSAQVQQLSASLRNGEGGNLKTAQTVLRLRSMTRVYERAATQECPWVAENDANTDALKTTVTENLSENPCFDQAQALMAEQWETTQEQVCAMNMATQFLVTHSCTDEDAQRIAAECNGAPQDGAATEESVSEHMQASNEEVDTGVEEVVEALLSTESDEPSLIQLTDSAQFVPILNEIVGLVAFLLIWAVLCIVFIPVILMVIGAVLCTLMWVIRRFMNSFGHGQLGSCMNWWAHQTQLMFSPGNELVTAGACLIAGWFGAIPALNVHASFPHLGIYIRGR